ncbi:MAG: acylhydrolase [candidate division Zixibacteria bacterium]|nr:acylhydrolase [candidate division Zixibacteria bacterium]
MGSGKLLMALLIISLLFNITAILGGIKVYRILKVNKEVLGHYLKLKSDIAGAGHYKNENLELISENSNNYERVIFFGASITERMDFTRYFPGKNYINRGVSGQLAPQMLGRFYQDVISLDPNSVIIKICAINFQPHLDETAAYDAVKMMVDLCNSNNIQPILATIIPIDEAYDKSTHGNNYTTKIKAFNRWLRKYGKGNDVRIIDYFNVMSTAEGYLKPEYNLDGLHPNENGYQVIAETVVKELSPDKVLY